MAIVVGEILFEGEDVEQELQLRKGEGVLVGGIFFYPLEDALGDDSLSWLPLEVDHLEEAMEEFSDVFLPFFYVFDGLGVASAEGRLHFTEMSVIESFVGEVPHEGEYGNDI